MDLNKLSVRYTILDYESGEIKEISVMDSDDLYAITGMFSGQEHCADRVSGRFADIAPVVPTPQDVTWYAAAEDEFCIEQALTLARAQGNSLIVVEILPDPAEDVGVWQTQ